MNHYIECVFRSIYRTLNSNCLAGGKIILKIIFTSNIAPIQLVSENRFPKKIVYMVFNY